MPEEKVFNCPKPNIRKIPGVAADNIITVPDVNDKADILGKENEWYKVKTQSNTVGYVSGKCIMVL